MLPGHTMRWGCQEVLRLSNSRAIIDLDMIRIPVHLNRWLKALQGTSACTIGTVKQGESLFPRFCSQNLMTQHSPSKMERVQLLQHKCNRLDHSITECANDVKRPKLSHLGPKVLRRGQCTPQFPAGSSLLQILKFEF